MKKTILRTLAASLAASSLFALASCGTKLPTTQYEKVVFALNGVESSFRNIKTEKSKSLLKQNLPSYHDSQTALDNIYALYTEGDYQGSSLSDEISYNEPPMVQFQCIKRAFEKIGKDYEFGINYYDDITGIIYLDIDKGTKAKEQTEEYKYDFVFTLDIQLNIALDDSIQAKVGFDINFSKGEESYHSQWYVEMYLEYDMQDTNPTYELLMLTQNDDSDVPYFDRMVYEYDYVDTNKGAIQEWRKFVLETNQKIYKNDKTPSFSDYTSDPNFTFRADTTHWFKNGKFFKQTNTTRHEEEIIASNMFDGLGMNSEYIDSRQTRDEYNSKRNSVVKELYKEFSEAVRDELVYQLIVNDEDEQKEEEKQIDHIVLVEGSENYLLDYKMVTDLKFHELFTGFVDLYGDKYGAHLTYFDNEDHYHSDVEDITKLTYKFALCHDDMAYGDLVDVSLDDQISDTIKEYVDSYGSEFTTLMYIEFWNVQQNVKGSVHFMYYDDKIIKPKAVFPEALSELGLPTYDNEKADFTYTFVDPYHYLYIENSSVSEAEAYRNDLYNAGFTLDNEHSGLDYFVYTIGLDAEHYVYVELAYYKDAFKLTVTVFEYPEEEPEEITMLSLTGTWNNFGDNVGVVDLEKNGSLFTIKDFQMEENTKFKIISNHSWANGGFGYSKIYKFNGFYDYFYTEGEYDDIIITTTALVTLSAVVDGTSVSIEIKNVIPVM